MRAATTCALIFGLLFVGAPAAHGAVTVSSTGGVITVQGDDGPNNITVTSGGGNYTFNGANAAGANCAGAGPVTCPTAGVTSITASLLKDIDVWDSTGIDIPTTVDLAEGFDFTFQRARTGEAADTILGGPDQESDIVTQGGNDTIRLLGGNDAANPFIFTGGFGSLQAGAGDDTIELGDGQDGGTGAGFIDGGPGDDTYDLGTGNDRNIQELAFPSGSDTVNAGPGDDGVTFGFSMNDGADTVRGGPDEDVLSSQPDGFNDLVDGGSGDDTLAISDFGPNIGEPANSDLLLGGSGRDAIAGGASQSAVTFTANGVGDDGYNHAPRTANLGPDIELMTGTANFDTLGGGPGTLEIRGLGGADVLSAGTAATRLDGGAGGDTLNGGPADDTLLGGLGIDGLNGNDGNDLLNGGSEGDTLNGGNGRDTGDWSAAASPVTLTPGDAVPDGENNEGDLLAGDVENLLGGPFNDNITGAPGPSMLASAGGDDTITATDGAADIVLCGAGDDGVGADTDDTVELTGTERCERVTKPPVEPPVVQPPVVTPPVVTPPVVVPPEPLPTLGLSGKVDKKGRQKLQIACPAAAVSGCAGDVRLVDKSDEPISRKAAFSVAAGGTTKVPVQLDEDAVKTLKKKHKLAARILAEVAGADDTFRRAVADVKLKQ